MPSSPVNYDDESNFKAPELKVKFVAVPKTRLKSFQRVFSGPLYKDGLFKSEPGDFVFNPLYAGIADKIYRIEPRKVDDVWLVTCPKAGTTWASEMLWLIMNNYDFERALKEPLMERTFFPEMDYFTPPRPGEKPFSVAIEKTPPPRVIKTHLPFFLVHPKLLETSKVVYVARNPKDCIVSFYFHHKLIKFQGFEGSIDDFAQYFMDNQVIYCPFFPHVIDAWNKRHHPNMLFIFYEDLKNDLQGQLQKMAKFLGKDLSEDHLNRLTEHLKFKNFQKNESVNNEFGKKMGMMNEDGNFIRKGKVGDWKNHFSAEMNKKLDLLWIEKNLAGTDLKFVSELESQD